MYWVVIGILVLYMAVVCLWLCPLTCAAGCAGRGFLAADDRWNGAQTLTIGIMAILNGFLSTVIVNEAGNVTSQCAAATIVNIGTAFGAVDMLKNSVIDVMIANAASLASIAGIGFYSPYYGRFSASTVSWVSLAPLFASSVSLVFYFGCCRRRWSCDVFEVNTDHLRQRVADVYTFDYGQLVDELDGQSHFWRFLYVCLTAAVGLYIGSVPFEQDCLGQGVTIHHHSWPQEMLAASTIVSSVLLVFFELMHLIRRYGLLLWISCLVVCTRVAILLRL